MWNHYADQYGSSETVYEASFAYMFEEICADDYAGMGCQSDLDQP